MCESHFLTICPLSLKHPPARKCWLKPLGGWSRYFSYHRRWCLVLTLFNHLIYHPIIRPYVHVNGPPTPRSIGTTPNERVAVRVTFHHLTPSRPSIHPNPILDSLLSLMQFFVFWTEHPRGETSCWVRHSGETEFTLTYHVSIHPFCLQMALNLLVVVVPEFPVTQLNHRELVCHLKWSPSSISHTQDLPVVTPFNPLWETPSLSWWYLSVLPEYAVCRQDD